MTTSTSLGCCPSCEASGRVGAACHERVCQRNGMHCVPVDYARRALALDPSQREPLVGQYVDDFLVVGRLGRGGFGKVLEALQGPQFRLRAAVKLLEFTNPDARTSRKVLDKFETEAAALAVLQHPNVVRLLKFGRFHDRPFMAMEFIPGARTLQTEIHRLVQERASLPPEVVRHVLDQILNALEAAHAEGIVHRDVKPENVMLQAVVGDPHHVKLVDFGLAKFLDEGNDTSLVLGTVVYMAPEQIEGKNLGPWTDLYAVGAIAFELITGHRAFVGKDNQQVLRLKLSGQYDPVAQLGAGAVEPATAEFLRRILARYPEQRYQSTAAVREALARVFDGERGAPQFSRDLSQLLDSEELDELRRESERLARERDALDADRRALEAAQRRFHSERVRYESQRFGAPEVVEHAAIGDTGVVGVAATPTPAIAPSAAGTPWPTGLQTGLPPQVFAPQVAEEARPARARAAIWALAALVVAGGGVGLAFALGGGSGEASVAVPEERRVAAPEPPAEQPQPA
ncbi:MAG: protein kinase, partial [Myxococcales bacterium]|nr:protein kinase [Myxococcales bacterium]